MFTMPNLFQFRFRRCNRQKMQHRDRRRTVLIEVEPSSDNRRQSAGGNRPYSDEPSLYPVLQKNAAIGLGQREARKSVKIWKSVCFCREGFSMNRFLLSCVVAATFVFTPGIVAAQSSTAEPKSASQTQSGSQTKAQASPQTITFASADGLKITADLYMPHTDKKTPFIVLCHQAGWSRGEYRETAPKLNKLGFNCLAIDQRSGGKINGVDNETFKLAKAASKGVSYVDAEQDIIAALKYAKANYADNKVILWGSSYSSSLALRIGGEHSDLVDGVAAFAPGEYFQRSGKPGNWIETSAAKISDPVFVTSAKKEYSGWKSIFKAIPGKDKVSFIPKTAGNHGSRALWNKFNDSKDYWKALESFLKPFAK